MTRRVGRTVIIEPTVDAKCELCGKVDELRPYGHNGESICFECGMKNRETTDAAFARLLDGADDVKVKPS